MTTRKRNAPARKKIGSSADNTTTGDIGRKIFVAAAVRQWLGYENPRAHARGYGAP